MFSDEFEGQALDTRKWVTCYWWKEHWWLDNGCTNESQNELQWYQADNALVGDGMLRLRAQRRTVNTLTFGNTYRYTSGMISTGRDNVNTGMPPKFAFQYGYVEIRARAPAGQGLFPAFWLLPASHNSRPEIDVMEILGHDTRTLHMNFHYVTADGEPREYKSDWAGPDFSDNWHTFAVDWRPESIVWYVDGIERKRIDDPVLIPREPMYLILNLAVGGEWARPPDSATVFPRYFEVDYVRVRVRVAPPYTAVESASPAA